MNSTGLFNHAFIYMGHLHLVLPALNLTTLAGSWHFDGATRKNDDAITEHVVLLCVLPLALHLTFFMDK